MIAVEGERLPDKMEAKLLKDPFWNKKLDKAARVRDTDHDGKISQHDFDLVLQRYGKLTGATKAKVEACQRFMKRFLAQIGLDKPSKSLTYDQYKHGIAGHADNPNKDDYYTGLFDILDANANGIISSDEWATHYKCLGIDPAHARASFAAMDLNKSGTVTRDEFVAYHCEFFFSAEDKLNSSILFGPLD